MPIAWLSAAGQVSGLAQRAGRPVVFAQPAAHLATRREGPGQPWRECAVGGQCGQPSAVLAPTGRAHPRPLLRPVVPPKRLG